MIHCDFVQAPLTENVVYAALRACNKQMCYAPGMYVAIAMATSTSSSCLGCDDRGFVVVFGQTRPDEQRTSACCIVLEENDYLQGVE